MVHLKLNEEQFKDIKREIKLHSVAYIVMKYELAGIDLSNEIVTRIKKAKSFGELGALQSKT